MESYNFCPKYQCFKIHFKIVAEREKRKHSNLEVTSRENYCKANAIFYFSCVHVSHTLYAFKCTFYAHVKISTQYIHNAHVFPKHHTHWHCSHISPDKSLSHSGLAPRSVVRC